MQKSTKKYEEVRRRKFTGNLRDNTADVHAAEVGGTASADHVNHLRVRARRGARSDKAAAQLATQRSVDPHATEHEPGTDNQGCEVDNEQEEREPSAVRGSQGSSNEARQQEEADQSANEEREEELGTSVEHTSAPRKEQVDNDDHNEVNDHSLEGLHFLSRHDFLIREVLFSHPLNPLCRRPSISQHTHQSRHYHSSLALGNGNVDSLA